MTMRNIEKQVLSFVLEYDSLLIGMSAFNPKWSSNKEVTLQVAVTCLGNR